VSIPFFSIITATYNAATTLKGLLQSLEEQKFRDFEFIVQDGASYDGTLAVVNRSHANLPSVLLASEKDIGIYDAWNKAVSRARGRWLLFLGADDRLIDSHALSRVYDLLLPTHNSIDFYAFALLLTLPDGHPVEIWKPTYLPLKQLPFGMPFPHPSLFYSMNLFVKNQFSASFKIAGDYDFLCKTLCKNNYRCDHQVVTKMSIGGVSSSISSMLESELECLNISRKYFPCVIPVKIYVRLIRSGVCMLISKLLGESASRVLADIVRVCLGKPRLWTRRSRKLLPRPLPYAPLISIIVATLGRREELRRLLESIVSQEYRNFELIIVDQNPKSFISEVVGPYLGLIQISVLETKSLGVSHARNLGLESARGDIIAFPDDDCWYAQHTLSRVVEVFQNYPKVGGYVVSWDDGSGNLHVTPKVSEAINIYDTFHNAGALVQFYRAEILEGIMFDIKLGPGSSLPYGCGEDTDFLIQVIKQGVVVNKTSEVLVYHPKPDVNNPELIAKTYAYAQGRMYLLEKYKFPIWFRLLNILYPLVRYVIEDSSLMPYRKAMFLGRLKFTLRDRSQS
jgi:glycosyltransferase involved in cell wall biosynthesis